MTQLSPLSIVRANGQRWTQPRFLDGLKDGKASGVARTLARDRKLMEVDPAFDIPGMAPNFAQYPLPHVTTFQGLNTSAARVYRTSDEALMDSWENARYMRNDVGIMECVEARQRAVALLPWHIEPEDESDASQGELAEKLTKIIQRISRFNEYRLNLLHGVWFGRYAIQHRYAWVNVGGREVCMPAKRRDDPGWKPVHGDKLVWRFDGGENKYPDQMGIRVGTKYKPGTKINDKWTVEATDRGNAYFLADWERSMFAVHKHTIEDGAFEDPLQAGMIHGVGIRHRVYWEWFQKQEALAFMMDFLERSSTGVEIYYYPEGNEAARIATEKAASERSGNGRNMIFFPRPAGDDAMQYGMEFITPGTEGVSALKDLLTDYFGHRIKRYILGQILSSEAQATGLGSGVADFQYDTLQQIIRYDAGNLQETITDDLVHPIQLWNFPSSRGIHMRFVIDVETPDVDKKLEAVQKVYEMGGKISARQVMTMTGLDDPDGPEDTLQSPEAQQAAAGNMGGGFGPGANGQGGGPPIGPQDFNPNAIAEQANQQLFGDSAEDGAPGKVAYVAEGGKWEEREIPEGDTGDRVPVGRNKKEAEAGERWITIGGGEGGPGTHVKVKGGKITGGPKGLKGKALDDLGHGGGASEPEAGGEKPFALKRDPASKPGNTRTKQGQLFDPESIAAADEQLPGAKLKRLGLSQTKDGRWVGAAQMNIADIKADPKRFQFKISGIGEGGVTDELKGVKQFNPEFGGQLLVWHDPADGQVYVINGHHRHELASRSQKTEDWGGDLPVYFVNAKNATEARARGALANIAEGRGTSVDAAKFLRDSGGSIDTLREEGVSLKGKVAADGVTLSQLSDPIFSKLTAGLIDENRALAIAGELGNDHDLQNELFKEIGKIEAAKNRDIPDSVVREMAREYKQAPTTTETTKSLFGESEDRRSLMFERNAIKSEIRQMLGDERAAFKAVAGSAGEKRKGTLERGGINKIDVDKSREELGKAEIDYDTFDRLVNYRGPIADAVNQGAKEFANAPGPKARKRIAAGIVARIRELAAQDDAGRVSPGVPGREGDAGSGGSGGVDESADGLGADDLGPKGYKPAANARAMFSRVARDVVKYRLRPDQITTILRDEYAKKKKHDPNQKTLNWITLESGTHVALDGDGTIKKGPPALKGKTPDELSGESKSDDQGKPSGGKTRDLTEGERAEVDAAYDEYLDATKAQLDNPGKDSIRKTQEAWDGYQSKLKEMGVRSTLAGYRIADKDSGPAPESTADDPEDDPDDDPIDGGGPEDSPDDGPDLAGGDAVADPLQADNPREAAAKQAEAEKASEYEFARESKISNAGEDLKGSARHKVNAWRGNLAEAEENGTAAEIVTRDNLLKLEPHNLMAAVDKDPANSLTALAMYLSLKSFPPKPGYGKKANHRIGKGKDDEKNRQQYLDAYRRLKSKAEALAVTELDSTKALTDFHHEVGEIINEFRNGDRYNETANGLCGLSSATATSRWDRKRGGVYDKLEAFAKKGVEVDGDFRTLTDHDAKKEAFGKYVDRVRAMIEGASLETAFGVTKEGRDRGETFNPAEAYVGIARREGGRKVPSDTPEQTSKFLTDRLKMRGVQYGNSMTDDERAHHLTKAAEALSDLADILGLPLEMMSNDGKLGIAFGARGRGGALAHYEQSEKEPVINLTRKNGVGSLAHEWGHFLDHHIGMELGVRGNGEDRFLSEQRNDKASIRTESGWEHRDYSKVPAYIQMAALREKMKTSGYEARMNEKIRGMVERGEMSEAKAKYWKSPLEMFARCFERFAQRRLESKGRANTYLAGIETKAYKHGGLWPTDAEVDAMSVNFDTLFNAIRTLKYPGKTRAEIAEANEKYRRRLREDFNREMERYKIKPAKGQGQFEWVTIGGAAGPDGKQHVGGTPVAIDNATGKIAKGPDALEGKAPHELGDGAGAKAEAPADPTEAAAAEYKKHGTRSKHFKAWFGDWENDPASASKVVDPETGEPKETAGISGEGSQVRNPDGSARTVYHGTKSGGFGSFEKRWGSNTTHGDPDALLYGPGFYFTEDSEVAGEYSGRMSSNLEYAPTREAAEAKLQEKRAEWESQFGKSKDDLKFDIVPMPGFTDGDQYSWQIRMTGTDKQKPRLSKTITGADARTMGRMFRDIADRMPNTEIERKVRYDALSRNAYNYEFGGHVSIDDYLLNPATYFVAPTAEDQQIAERARQAIGAEITRPQSEVKQVYLNVRKPFDADKHGLTRQDIENARNQLDETTAGLLIGKAEQYNTPEEANQQIEHLTAQRSRFEKSMAVEAAKLEEMGVDPLAGYPISPTAAVESAYGAWKTARSYVKDADEWLEFWGKKKTEVENRPLKYDQLVNALGKKSKVNEALAAMGYDGITHIGGQIMGNRDHRVWIAFEPNQIKSTDNRGTFDASDERMAYARRLQDAANAAIAKYKIKPSKDQKSFDWITIGGAAGDGGKKHVGGTPVAVDKSSGEIVKGPDNLEGKRPDELGKGDASGQAPKPHGADRLKDLNRAFNEAFDKLIASGISGKEDAGELGRAFDAKAAEMKEIEAHAADEYKRLGTKSKYFKNWFGDWEADPAGSSKVVNPETGEPQETGPIDGAATSMVRGADGRAKPVYHGTKAGGFTAFDSRKLSHPDNLLFGPGFYFTEDSSLADEYAGAVREHVQSFPTQRAAIEAKKVMEADHAKNPNANHRRARNYHSVTFEVEKTPPHPGQSAKGIPIGRDQKWRVVMKGFERGPAIPTRQFSKSDWLEVSKIMEDHAQAVFGTERSFSHSFYKGMAIRARTAAEDADRPEYASRNSPEMQRLYDYIADPVRETHHPDEVDKSVGDTVRRNLGVDFKANQNERKQVYLNIRKPFDGDHSKISIRDIERADLDPVIVDALKQSIYRSDPMADADRPVLNYQRLHNALGGKQRAAETLMALGYDGITHIGGQIMGNKDHRVWIAFRPNQIKATNNRGTFDESSDRIDYARPGEKARESLREQMNRAFNSRIRLTNP